MAAAPFWTALTIRIERQCQGQGRRTLRPSVPAAAIRIPVLLFLVLFLFRETNAPQERQAHAARVTCFFFLRVAQPTVEIRPRIVRTDYRHVCKSRGGIVLDGSTHYIIELQDSVSGEFGKVRRETRRKLTKAYISAYCYYYCYWLSLVRVPLILFVWIKYFYII